jgi:transcription initiation factor TFIIIB Brf1 subunit/transcription initiation factor TFIIB
MDIEIWDIYNEINNSYLSNESNEKDIDFNIESATKINNNKESNSETDNKLKQKCINCKMEDFLLVDSEMVVCTYCGVENEMIIDYNAEWRYYGTDDNKKSADPNRCGMPSNRILPDTSLSTIILGRGNEIFRKLHSWNGLTYKHRSLIGILNKIALKANIDNVPQSIIDATMNMYKMISQDYIKRGASRESLIAACFFNALRDQGLIRSPEEVAKLFDIKSKKLSKGCNEFTELMFSKNKEYVKNMKPIESKDLVDRFGTVLEINREYINIGIKVAILVDKLGICQENNPKSIAVGIIFMISQHFGLGLTKKEIAESCKTSEVTVGNTYGQMIKFKKYLISP